MGRRKDDLAGGRVPSEVIGLPLGPVPEAVVVAILNVVGETEIEDLVLIADVNHPLMKSHGGGTKMRDSRTNVQFTLEAQVF